MKKIALVTGGNRGIGFAVCEALAKENIQVLLGSRNNEKGIKAAKQLQDKGLDVTAVPIDVSNIDSILQAKEMILSQFGPVSILINNAGVLFNNSMLTAHKSELETTVSVNLMGPIHCLRTFIPDMLKLDYGRIVNVSSEWGSFACGLDGPGLYGVTKAALNGLTKRLSKELPSTIKINSLCPGSVHTDMGGPHAPRSPTKGAETIIWLALMDETGPTGGFFQDKKPIDW